MSHEEGFAVGGASPWRYTLRSLTS
jgi:hypothetical protein